MPGPDPSDGIIVRRLYKFVGLGIVVSVLVMKTPASRVIL